jgi:acyl-CoA reductase-like NAD-dependent aldehyde dehydrogenase
MRMGFRVGPFYFSQRVGRTQAQKRAAAKARDEARAARAQRRWRNSPEAKAQVAAAHARLDRQYTGPVSELVTGSDGGVSFVITDRTKGTMGVKVAAEFAGKYRHLHNGDILQAVFKEDHTGFERIELLWYASGRDGSSSPFNYISNQ